MSATATPTAFPISKPIRPTPPRSKSWRHARRCEWISIEYAQPKHSPELLKHCGDKGVILGVLDLATENIEEPQAIAQRTRAALEFVPPQRLNLAPDCGMWHLPRPVAFAKLRALVQGAEIVRRELNLTA